MYIWKYEDAVIEYTTHILMQGSTSCLFKVISFSFIMENTHNQNFLQIANIVSSNLISNINIRYMTYIIAILEAKI